jgi:hypothetical protein
MMVLIIPYNLLKCFTVLRQPVKASTEEEGERRRKKI